MVTQGSDEFRSVAVVEVRAGRVEDASAKQQSEAKDRDAEEFWERDDGRPTERDVRDLVEVLRGAVDRQEQHDAGDAKSPFDAQQPPSDRPPDQKKRNRRVGARDQ